MVREPRSPYGVSIATSSTSSRREGGRPPRPDVGPGRGRSLELLDDPENRRSGWIEPGRRARVDVDDGEEWRE
jgi:hypothetical protein